MSVLPPAFTGCLLGLALGDALGAPYEGGPLERALWSMIGKTGGLRRYTDDTQMALDVAESLIACGGVDQDDLARRFATSCRWSRGYGAGAAKTLKLIRRGVDWRTASTAVYKSGSYGNGAAMRSPVIGLWFAGDENRIEDAARQVAVVTHAHPLAQEGAVLIALAVKCAAMGAAAGEILTWLEEASCMPEYRRKLAVAADLFRRSIDDASAIRAGLGNGVAALDSCVTAVYLACRYVGEPFLDMLAAVRRLGGDVDTIGAMAGAIWGAAPTTRIAFCVIGSAVDASDRRIITCMKIPPSSGMKKTISTPIPPITKPCFQDGGNWRGNATSTTRIP